MRDFGKECEEFWCRREEAENGQKLLYAIHRTAEVMLYASWYFRGTLLIQPSRCLLNRNLGLHGERFDAFGDNERRQDMNGATCNLRSRQTFMRANSRDFGKE